MRITASIASSSLEQVPSLADFYASESRDLLDKCGRFAAVVRRLREARLFQSQFRLKLLGPIDHRIVVEDPETGERRELLCFDSNSYLGLHLHPRVTAAARRALDEAGAGMPSAQLLAGTHRWLCELEELVAAFHRRPAAIVFPSGYAANVGALTGLLRPGDLVVRDRFCHASIHDGCRWSGAEAAVYGHLAVDELDAILARAPAETRGRLVVSDGVFSMHGRLAPLPALRALADRHGARLMIDEAHGTGVIGATGRGLEERFALPGAADVLMGTFSKAPGAIGGYICGSGELCDYLRFYARASVFTASLPPSTCAALSEAFRVMDEEPEHRERLWRAARRLWHGLAHAGFALSPLESPILTLPVGSESRLFAISRELYQGGLKCGSVAYPAVPHGESLLRLTVNARHLDDELDRAVELLARVAAQHGILGRTAAELKLEEAA